MRSLAAAGLSHSEDSANTELYNFRTIFPKATDLRFIEILWRKRVGVEIAVESHKPRGITALHSAVAIIWSQLESHGHIRAKKTCARLSRQAEILRAAQMAGRTASDARATPPPIFGLMTNSSRVRWTEIPLLANSLILPRTPLRTVS
jgi:hypothetical protein